MTFGTDWAPDILSAELGAIETGLNYLKDPYTGGRRKTRRGGGRRKTRRGGSWDTLVSHAKKQTGGSWDTLVSHAEKQTGGSHRTGHKKSHSRNTRRGGGGH